MREKNYSQMPVIDGTSDLRGVLTWSSVARCLETGTQPTLGSAMVTDSIPVAEVHQQLLAHLPTITTHGYLLVRANNGTFCGIITSTDVGELVAFEVVHRVADEVVSVDAVDLVDEEPGLLPVDFQ